MLSLVYGNRSISGGSICIAFYPFLNTTKLCLSKSLYLNKSPPLNRCWIGLSTSYAFLPEYT